MDDEKLFATQKDNCLCSVSNAGEQFKLATSLEKVTLFLKRYGIETTGCVLVHHPLRLCSLIVRRIDPIPEESRTDTRLFQMFFVWFSCNMNILGCVRVRCYSGILA